ncbi:hypothetical protein [Clostridium sp. UBA1652]|uniref:hypothetical protein n=1 Tax=Clostridium sp. UBA1652 TaxID=1946348 RepID=UPI00257E5A95|nr:hypothetical protein [Clostridium sp. UBA1652]
MILEFKTNKIKKQCENPAVAQKEYGSIMGRKLTQRVMELNRAKNLLDIQKLPAARLHRLDGKRADEYAVDLVHPFRLVFTPLVDGGVSLNDLQGINIVRIEEVIDYHGKQKGK